MRFKEEVIETKQLITKEEVLNYIRPYGRRYNISDDIEKFENYLKFAELEELFNIMRTESNLIITRYPLLDYRAIVIIKLL